MYKLLVAKQGIGCKIAVFGITARPLAKWECQSNISYNQLYTIQFSLCIGSVKYFISLPEITCVFLTNGKYQTVAKNISVLCFPVQTELLTRLLESKEMEFPPHLWQDISI